MRSAVYPEVEEALVSWLKFAQSQNTPISGPVLQTKAEELATEFGYDDFKCSTGWLSRFKVRHDIVFRKLCDESAVVDEEIASSWREQLESILTDYEPKDVFNADETGLVFKLLPDRTFAFKGEDCKGGKKSKERLTVMVTANMDGSEKLPLMVIGKSKKPQCFKHVKSLPVQYEANKKAWMTGDLYTSWLWKLDRAFQKEKRKVLLFVDNCSAHPVVNGLKSIKVVFLPPNTTSKLQPMDQGIIKNLKVHYRKNLLLKYIAAVDSKQEFCLNLLDSVHMLRATWNAVLPKTIVGCYKYAGFQYVATDSDEEMDTVEDDEDVHSIWERLECVNEEKTFEDFTTIDENVMVTEEMSDSAIIFSMVKEKHASGEEVEESDDEDSLTARLPPPSASDAVASLETLRRFIEAQRNQNGSLFDSCNDKEKLILSCMHQKTVQSKLTDYFHTV